MTRPAADGLNRIRGRLSTPRPLAVAWLMVGWTSVGQPALLRMDELLVAFGEWLRAMLRPVSGLLHPVAERLRPVLQPAWSKVRALFTPRTESGGRPSGYAWLRPALAAAPDPAGREFDAVEPVAHHEGRPGLRSDRQRKPNPDGWRLQPDAKADRELHPVPEAECEPVGEHVAVAVAKPVAVTKPVAVAVTKPVAVAITVRQRQRQRPHVVR